MAGLARDRVTWLVYSHMAVYGYFLYGFGPTVPLLGDDLDVSRTVAGLHGAAMAVGAVLAGLVSPTIVRVVGRGVGIRLGLAGLAVGLAGYLAGTSVWVTLAGTVLAGTFGSIVINTHSAVLSLHHRPAGAAAISEANALAAGFGLLAPAVIGATTAAGLGWRAGLLLAAVAVPVVLAATARTAVPAETPTVASGPPGRHRARLPARFWLALAVLVLCVGTEFSFTFWASDLLRERAGASAAAATASIAVLVLGMTVGRIAGGRLALAHQVDALLAASLVVTSLGFAAFWLSTTLWLSVLGLGVVGLGISVQFPLSISRVLAASGGQPDQATARASIGAGFAIGTAPFLLGFLADQIGTHSAFLLVPVLLAGAAALLKVGRST